MDDFLTTKLGCVRLAASGHSWQWRQWQWKVGFFSVVVHTDDDVF
jgi:hypothetical protein